MNDKRSISRKSLKEKLKTISISDAGDDLQEAFDSLAGSDPAGAQDDDAADHNARGSDVDRVRSGERTEKDDQKKAN